MHETVLISSNYEFRMLQVREPPLFTNQSHILFIVFYTNSITTNREFFSKFLVKQTRVGGLWEAVALLPGGLGAGRSAAGRPVLQGPGRKFSAKLFVEKPLPPGSGAARYRLPGSGAVGVYSYKFRKQKYIFVNNEIEK